MGESALLFGWIKRIFPPLGLMRFPIKLVILPVFALPPLAAYAVKGCLEATPSAILKFRRDSFAVGGILLLVMAGILIYARKFPFADDPGRSRWKAALLARRFWF